LFQFINSYTTLYFIAFFKARTVFFGDSHLKDGCKAGNAPDPMYMVGWGCPDELTLQLATILGVNMFVGQATEVGIPWVMGFIKLYLVKRQHKNDDEEFHLPQWERESKKPVWAGTLDEYSEMVIQYGYNTLFAAAFPVTSLLSVLNNMVEIRTDAFKLVDATVRPFYRGAQNIGTWYTILEVLGVVAVITNCAMIGLSFTALNQSLGGNPFACLGIIVIIEHVILFAKFIIAVLIPDHPGWIQKEMAKQDYIRSQTMKQQARTASGKPEVKRSSEKQEDGKDEEESD